MQHQRTTELEADVIGNLLWMLGGMVLMFVIGYLLLVKFFTDMWR